MAKKAASKTAKPTLLVRVKADSNGELFVSEIKLPEVPVPVFPFGVLIVKEDNGGDVKAAGIVPAGSVHSEVTFGFLSVFVADETDELDKFIVTQVNDYQCMVEIDKTVDLNSDTIEVEEEEEPEPTPAKKPAAKKEPAKKDTKSKAKAAKEDPALTVDDDEDIEIDEIEEEELEDDELETDELEDDDLDDDDLDDDEVEDDSDSDDDELEIDELEDEIDEDEIDEDDSDSDELEDDETDEDDLEEEVMTDEEIARLLKKVRNSAKEEFLKTTADELGITYTKSWSVQKLKKAIINFLSSDIEE